MAQTEVFHCTINTEGPSSTRRAKIPAGVINKLGGEKGDFIEIEVTGTKITGGGIVRGVNNIKRVQDTLHTQSLGTRERKASAPKAKAKAKPTTTVKAKPVKTVAKKVVKAKPAKTNGKAQGRTKTTGKKVAVKLTQPRTVKKVIRKKALKRS